MKKNRSKKPVKKKPESLNWRRRVQFSAPQNNAAANEVLSYLEGLPPGQRSRALWEAALAGLRGGRVDGVQADEAQVDQVDDDLEGLLDNL